MVKGMITFERLRNLAKESGQNVPYYVVGKSEIYKYHVTPEGKIYDDILGSNYRGFVVIDPKIIRFLNYWHAYAYLLQKNAEKAEAQNA